VFGAHRPAAWQLTISSGKIPDLVPGGACEVSALGQVGAVARHDFSWAPYDFKPAPGDPLHGYDKPRILHAGGRVVLHLPAYESGTGNFNRELLYVWANDAWHDADVTAWHDELDRRLPKGLVILKGVYPDYEKMTAETPVWRQEDGPQCAEGGRAHVELQWRGDRIAVGIVRIGKAGAH